MPGATRPSTVAFRARAGIVGARCFEQPGDHSLRFAGSGDNDALLREIAEFLATAG